MRILTTSHCQASRGTTLLEVLISGAVLCMGLSGVLLYLGLTARTTRDGTLTTAAAEFGNNLIQEYDAMGYSGLAATPTSTPIQRTAPYPNNTRISATVAIVDNSLADALNVSYTVTATVTWNNAYGQAQTTMYQTVVSQPPPLPSP
jgi:Tfp pilus assembly protein PilV